MARTSSTRKSSAARRKPATQGIIPTPPPPQTINPRIYAAAGDGVTDDTAACQRAIDAAGATVREEPRKPSLTERLYALWSRINALCSSPWTALAALVLMTSWFAVSAWSNTTSSIIACDGHGRIHGCAFDPGGNYGNDAQNELQLVLLFVACSLGAQAVKHHHEHRSRLQDIVKTVRELLDSVGDDETA